MMNRRTFLGAASCEAFAALRFAEQGRAFTRAHELRLSNIGLQLYTVRGQLAADLDGTLGRVAALGFREVEFAGYQGRAPSQVKAPLRRHGISAPSAHVTTAELRDGLGKAIEAAQIVGHEYLVCGYVTPRSAARSTTTAGSPNCSTARERALATPAYSFAITTTTSSSSRREGKLLTTCCSHKRTRGS